MNAATTTRRLTYAVVFSGGASIDVQVDHPDSRKARQQVWDGLTDEQRDAVEDIECIGDEQVQA